MILMKQTKAEKIECVTSDIKLHVHNVKTFSGNVPFSKITELQANANNITGAGQVGRCLNNALAGCLTE